jgi:Nucleotidyl transferase AbiEii toxin, Type IV TA system
VLSQLQERVAKLVASLDEADGFALAGGAALVYTQVVDRATRDLDFFGLSPDDVDRLAPAVEAGLAAAGLDVRRERVSHGFVRLTVSDGTDVTELDLAADARIRPAEVGPLGPMLSAEELGADKLLALFDRAQARDFVDVAALVERFGLDRLCQLAAEKDPGFSRAVLAEMLDSFGRFTPDDFGLPTAAHDALARSVERWRAQLAANPPPLEPPDAGLELG